MKKLIFKESIINSVSGIRTDMAGNNIITFVKGSMDDKPFERITLTNPSIYNKIENLQKSLQYGLRDAGFKRADNETLALKGDYYYYSLKFPRVDVLGDYFLIYVSLSTKNYNKPEIKTIIDNFYKNLKLL